MRANPGSIKEAMEIYLGHRLRSPLEFFLEFVQPVCQSLVHRFLCVVDAGVCDS